MQNNKQAEVVGENQRESMICGRSINVESGICINDVFCLSKIPYDSFEISAF